MATGLRKKVKPARRKLPVLVMKNPTGEKNEGNGKEK